MSVEYDVPTLTAYAAGLVKLARHGVPVDVQELLVHGDPSRGIAPGSLIACISEAIIYHRREIVKQRGECPDCQPGE